MSSLYQISVAENISSSWCFWGCGFRAEALMISELWHDRPVNTLQIVCFTAPLPSAECQDRTLQPSTQIFHFVFSALWETHWNQPSFHMLNFLNHPFCAMQKCVCMKPVNLNSAKHLLTEQSDSVRNPQHRKMCSVYLITLKVTNICS